MSKPKIPQQILESLLKDEKVYAVATESRLKNIVAPRSIVATSQRLIVLEPMMGGLKHKVQDWQYFDIQNVSQKSGLAFAEIGFDTRFGQDFSFRNLDKSDAKHLAHVARTLISKARNPQSSPQPAAPPSAGVEVDPVKAAKLRFAQGEISKAELDEILAVLENV